MKIAICDDDIRDASVLEDLVAKYMVDHRMNIRIDIYTDSNKLMANVKEYMIIFLDIVMGDNLGIDVAKSIHHASHSTRIVYYSSNMEYAPDTYECYGDGFLVKPLDKQKVYRCLDRLFKGIRNSVVEFKEVDNGLTLCVHVNDIDYIESSGKYTYPKIKGKKYKCRKLLKEWMDILEEESFHLCKRGLLINLHAVNEIDAFNNLVLHDGNKIKLSKEIGEKFKEYLAQYWAVND